MRMLYLAALLCSACSCKPDPSTDDRGSTASGGAVRALQLQTYERRHAKIGQVLVPPVLMRLSGTLAQKNGCLIVASGNTDHALVFEKGRATYDATKRVLIVGSASTALGGPITVGGPFNQPAESFDLAAVRKRCGVDAVWLVTGATYEGRLRAKLG